MSTKVLSEGSKKGQRKSWKRMEAPGWRPLLKLGGPEERLEPQWCFQSSTHDFISILSIFTDFFLENSILSETACIFTFSNFSTIPSLLSSKPLHMPTVFEAEDLYDISSSRLDCSASNYLFWAPAQSAPTITSFLQRRLTDQALASDRARCCALDWFTFYFFSKKA